MVPGAHLVSEGGGFDHDKHGSYLELDQQGLKEFEIVAIHVLFYEIHLKTCIFLIF